jgi:hypothetical protein
MYESKVQDLKGLRIHLFLLYLLQILLYFLL